ncbi:MAG TPA: AMP-binding protein [Candidatus Acidoferrum sp.]|jgi:acyl-[acyl-carrier-protein]-phospholipid O-acyltransferase/long-chain-fatty-acid--[acyl-carrier-protein] ligase|nr:AMP-binding protein [Candidatus Acidoferrum sp.]
MSRTERVLYFFGRLLVRCFYRVNAIGLENLPSGGFLLVPNHISWVDALVLQLACPRPIRYVIDQEYYHKPILHPILRAIGCIPISTRHSHAAVRAAAEKIADGEIVCVFPEGQLERRGVLLRLHRGYELIARHSNAQVVPVWLDELWGSIFSFQGGRFFTKFPKRIPYPVTIAFGKPLKAEAADVATMREELLKLGEFCFSRRPSLDRHLAEECVRGLKRRRFATAVIEGTDHTRLSRAKLLGAAAALSRHLRKEFSDDRIAIVLPASKGSMVANLAVTLANKVPVDLNFTMGRAANETCCRRANLRVAISATPFIERLKDFPWPERVLKLDELLPRMKRQIIFWWIMSFLVPARLLLRLLQIPKKGGHGEAVLLFTSGTTGEPKGVVISHRNVVGNVSQFRELLDAKETDAILASLPFFHTFGSTVTLWYPLIEGVRIVTYPNPLEGAKNAALIERYKLTFLLATPTFLRVYLRKAEREQLRTLRLIITGAEKLPLDLASHFEKRFDKKVFEGYGLTETAPVVSVNLPDPEPGEPGEQVQPSSRLGSVGRLAPGMAAEIREPETDRKLSLHNTGMLWLRGANIFEGYLHDPKRTAEILRDGWLKTGDIGRFDEDGFLYIEGRLSRFSKIGGEMVPHETIEQKIIDLLELSGRDERPIAIVGVQDEAKGEALVLLSAVDLDLAELRKKLQEAGVPNLWIPKNVHLVEAIPVLASGKLDLKKCQGLAAGP